MSLCNPTDLGAVRYLAIDDSILGNSTVKGAASNLAARAIRQLAMRMPELKGLVFVRNQATSITIKEAEDHCIELQRLIDSAMGEVSSEFTDWEAPPWCTAKVASDVRNKLWKRDNFAEMVRTEAAIMHMWFVIAVLASGDGDGMEPVDAVVLDLARRSYLEAQETFRQAGFWLSKSR
ncbi:hypothetical protein GCG54_00003903 [Colletotrichum gloeosporioides]|uniref:Uncharacterized protein n=1 Tax=Colletotrichum gloeosporioides TaxID=474922 RepID=A0A8H4FCZ8_COLGL|nr:uncharacterized protein GCG54_00003903 [Colletotrichum gloeosporioides]KAF3798003.1 hypothetical protein GCG54_00003903 [Colletotrichum gloeosporioides]